MGSAQTLKDFRYPKTKRLASNRQFKTVLDRRQRAGDRLLTLFVAENSTGNPRLGISVGKSCGNAVVRNRLKRLLREAFRQSQDRIPPGFDYVLLVAPALARRLKHRDDRKKTLATLTCEQIQRSFLSLVESVFARRQDRTPAPPPGPTNEDAHENNEVNTP